MSPPWPNETVAKRLRWLLLLPPCLPGVLILLLWWTQVPPRPAPGTASAGMRSTDALEQQKADGLYTAGTVALLGGVLMATFIAWKILRPPPPDEEEDESDL